VKGSVFGAGAVLGEIVTGVPTPVAVEGLLLFEGPTPFDGVGVVACVVVGGGGVWL
jgi:hypothetical protein